MGRATNFCEKLLLLLSSSSPPCSSDANANFNFVAKLFIFLFFLICFFPFSSSNFSPTTGKRGRLISKRYISKSIRRFETNVLSSIYNPFEDNWSFFECAKLATLSKRDLKIGGQYFHETWMIIMARRISPLFSRSSPRGERIITF